MHVSSRRERARARAHCRVYGVPSHVPRVSRVWRSLGTRENRRARAREGGLPGEGEGGEQRTKKQRRDFVSDL